MSRDQFVAEVGQALDALRQVNGKKARIEAVRRVVQMVEEWAAENSDGGDE